DLFPDRSTGVMTLLQRIEEKLGLRVRVWMGTLGLGTLTEARSNNTHVGSTNYLSTATLVARHYSDALLIDFGSTTADIIPIRGGKAVPLGLTDAIRQKTGELVYTGYTRTAVMGVTNRAPFKGEWVSLAREYLANMADVRRILGMRLDEVDLHATADGKDKSVSSSLQRFARMLGRDQNEGSEDEWHVSALYVREQQIKTLSDGLLQVLSQTTLSQSAPVIAAGIGEEEVFALASRFNKLSLSFSSCIHCPPELKKWASACAPAVAVALLSTT
ncbi:MAG: hydantoinase/oxoprolinase family protein, partial [Hyphomicrobium sp.]